MKLREYLKEDKDTATFGNDKENLKLYKKWKKDVGSLDRTTATPIVYSPSNKILARGTQGDILMKKYGDAIVLMECKT